MAQNQGWLKLHRKFIEWEWFENSEMVHLFLYLLLKANHKDDTWQGIKVKRGTLITGRKRLSDATKIPEQTIRTCLNKLKRTHEITTTTDSTKQYTIITICNYDSYQEENNTTNQPINQQTNQELTNNQPATNQELTTNKNEKNEKNEEKSNDISDDISAKIKKEEIIIKAPKEKIKKFVIPTIEEVANYCAERNNGVDAEKFWNYYNSIGWVRGKSKIKITSWHSCVTTWEKSNNQSSQTQTNQQSIRSKRASKALGRI